MAFSYDEAGNPLTMTDPLGNVSSSVYDACQRPIATVDPLGHRTTLGYDLSLIHISEPTRPY